MFTIPHVFSSGALFLQNSTLTISGNASANAVVSAKILAENGDCFFAATALADEKGDFSLTLSTPAASFKPYTVALSSDKGDSHIMTDVLFGELWLATGQSNMELANASLPHTAAMYESIRSRKIRAYFVKHPVPDSGPFPWNPDHSAEGDWIHSQSPEGFDPVSALATSFSRDLFDKLNRDADVPVGFLNSCWGGTNMVCWLPRDAVNADTFLHDRLADCGMVSTEENWNSAGGGNFQQMHAMYNAKIAPLEGVKVRGVLWYQGENDVGNEFEKKIYGDLLRFYHRVYGERFAADKEHFPMICSLLAPWFYGDSGECNRCYLNDAIVETAVGDPDKFTFTPVGDLPLEWSYHTGNHPIHPTHKYPVGARFAKLAYANAYGEGQKAAASLVSCEKKGDSLLLTFRNVGTGLRMGGGMVRTLYVAGADDLYLPAEAQILSPDTLKVWCDAITDPVNVAYAVQSPESNCNLYAGDFPVAPFFTDRSKPLNIEARVWYDTSAHTVLTSKIHEEVLDFFYRPIWLPLGDCEVCHDEAFRRDSVASIRVAADGPVFGCRVKSYFANKLNFEKFGGMEVSLFNTKGLDARLRLRYADAAVELPFEKISELSGSWSRWKVTFGELPAGEIQAMEFLFTQNGNRYHFVNLERPRLLKK